MAEKLSHVDDRGRVRMVDVGDKPIVQRRAVAEGYVRCAAPTLKRLLAGDLPKGEALAAARVAGIMAAKRCDELIPLCHQLPLDAVNVDFEATSETTLRIWATVTTTARTGVEMEALTAVSVAALTVWDMVKAIDKDLQVDGIALLEKTKSPQAMTETGEPRRVP